MAVLCLAGRIWLRYIKDHNLRLLGIDFEEIKIIITNKSNLYSLLHSRSRGIQNYFYL